MISSPYERRYWELKLLRLCALFDIETDSKRRRSMFKAHAWFYQVAFYYVGYLFQLGSLYYVESVNEVAETLCIFISCGTPLIKLMLCFPNRYNMRRLFDKIECENYRVQESDEHKCYII